MKVTQEILDELVAKIVPKEYRPAYKGPDVPPPTVTNIDVMERSKLEEKVAKHFPEDKRDDGKVIVTSGIHYNWGLLRKAAKLPDWKKWMKSSSIFIADDILGGTLHLTFILLHEVGHVDWNTRRDKLRFWRQEDEELYCDTYAYGILKEEYDEETAFIIMRLFGSIDGWNAGILDD